MAVEFPRFHLENLTRFVVVVSDGSGVAVLTQAHVFIRLIDRTVVGLVHQVQFIRKVCIFCSALDDSFLHPLLQLYHITDMQQSIIVVYYCLMQ